MLTTLASYQMITRNLQASLQRVSETPQVARETEYYLSRIGDIDTVDEFLADDRVYRYAMEAAGLGEMIYAKAFMRKALTEGIDDPDSFANKLADPRYRDFVRRFNFSRYGATATTFTRARQGVVDDYMRQKLEKDAGEDNEGVRLALYFQRKAPEIDNAYEILADPALLKVAETILGYSLTSGDIDRNAERLSGQIDIAGFADPRKLEKFLERFAAQWELAGNAQSPAGGGGVLYPRPTEAGIGQDLLQSLQNIRPAGR